MRAYQIFEGSESSLTKAQMDFIIHTMQTRPIDSFTYEAIKLGNKFLIIETSTNVIVYETRDESEADELCDQFNHDKDMGKDALVYSLKTNRKKYNI